ncbi:MAG: hypothetical protein AAF098_20000 [Pseudomonadota bacterium]
MLVRTHAKALPAVLGPLGQRQLWSLVILMFLPPMMCNSTNADPRFPWDNYEEKLEERRIKRQSVGTDEQYPVASDEEVPTKINEAIASDISPKDPQCEDCNVDQKPESIRP